MSTTSTRRILVVSATGRQGSSVIQSLLKETKGWESNDKWKIVGTTRDLQSQKAKELMKEGVEMIKADLNDGQSLIRAFHGVDTVFLVTHAWDNSQKGEKERKAGILAANIAKDAGVKHMIYSSSPNVEKFSEGKLNVPHMTNKALVEDHIRKLNFPKCTFLELSHYLGNWFDILKTEDKNQTIVFNLPIKSEFHNLDINMVGDVVVYTIKHADELHEKSIFVENGQISGSKFADLATKILGKHCKFNFVEPDQFRKSPICQGAEELCDMYLWFEDFGFFGPEVRKKQGIWARDLLKKESVCDVEGWLRREKDNILASLKKAESQV